MTALGSVFEPEPSGPRGPDLRAEVVIGRDELGAEAPIVVRVPLMLEHEGAPVARVRSPHERGEEITLRLPADFPERGALRLRGQGGACPAGRPGDLVLSIAVVPTRGASAESPRPGPGRAWLGPAAALGLLGLVLAALALGLLASGCAAATCRQVAASLEDFDRGERGEPGIHAVLTIPHRTLEHALAPALRELPAVSVPLPEFGGFSLGRVGVAVEGLRIRPAPADRIGVTVQLALKLEQRTALGFELDAELKPRVDAARGALILPIRAADLRGARPRVGPGGTRSLADHVHGALPPAARGLVGRAQLAALLDGAVDELSKSALAELARRLGERPLTELELELGGLPVQAVALRSTPESLVVGMDLGFGAVRPLEPSAQPVAPGRVGLRIGGDGIARLANWAMQRGLVPARFGDDGQPDPRGRWHARLDWQDAPAPLRVRLWCLQGDCAQVVLAASPRLGLVDGQLELSAHDAKIAEVRGSAKVRAGVFFSGLGRQSFQFVERVAAGFSIEAGPRTLAGRIAEVRLEGRELRLILAVQAR